MGTIRRKKKGSTVSTNTKRFFYLLYLVLKPMGISYSSSLFFVAALISFLEKNQILSDGTSMPGSLNIVHSLLEEEILNIFLMVFLVPSGDLFKFMIHLSLYIWAVLHTAELCWEQLLRNPQTPGLSALHPVIEFIVISKVELTLLKNMIEVFIGSICVPCVFVAKVALIFPILYFQYVRIKFVSSLFCKKIFELIDTFILRTLVPSFIYDSAPFQWVLSFGKSFFKFESTQ